MANKHAKAKNLRARALVSLVAIIVVVAVCAYLGLCGFGKGTMINYLKPWGDAISLGLDLRGGVYTVYQAENNGDPDFDTKMESTVSILTSRLTRQGFTEATVTRQGSDRIRVETTFIAALLTIVGYSINNTIIIFDRIRENSHKSTLRQLNRESIVNLSVQESLSRTLNTTITTLLTIVTLYIMGVDSIKQFALPLIIGIVAGTYSANLINGYVWAALMDKRDASKRAKAKA